MPFLILLNKEDTGLALCDTPPTVLEAVLANHSNQLADIGGSSNWLSSPGPASVPHLGLHRMRSGTVLSVGRPCFDSAQSPTQNHCSYTFKNRIDLKRFVFAATQGKHSLCRQLYWLKSERCCSVCVCRHTLRQRSNMWPFCFRAISVTTMVKWEILGKPRFVTQNRLHCISLLVQTKTPKDVYLEHLIT